eukprot:COSAG02_NODE_5129_length_4606_cov_1.720085_7_plen_23_part_01
MVAVNERVTSSLASLNRIAVNSG